MADQNPNQPEPAPTPPGSTPPAEAMAEQALDAAQEAVSNLQQNVATEAPKTASPAASAGPAPFEPRAFDRTENEAPPKGIDLLSDVNLNVKIELGRTRMLVEDVLKLSEGAVVELDKLAGDPVDVYVNERHIARGEVLVLNDNFCVRINEIVQDQQEGAQR
jgi:flagellar motor switch protein FliN/FliY